MAGFRTRFGKWLTVFCAERGMWIADLSEYLGVAPATLSLIISGQHPIPTFLRENIISAFCLRANEVKELDAAIQETKTEAVIVEREFEQCVMVQTPNHAKWTKEMMELMAKKVNSMTEEEYVRIRKSLMTVSEKTEEETAMNFKQMPDDILHTHIRRRYTKRPDVADRIMNYIKENME